MAVTVVIDDFPKSISSDPFSIHVSISGAKDGTNYLRIELYKDGTNNYFGETFSGTSWYAGADGLQYFPVQITGASASATLQGRLGNPSGGDYSGPGQYDLKVKRYTASGNAASGDSVNTAAIEINYNLTTPTPEPQATRLVVASALPTNLPSPVVLADTVEVNLPQVKTLLPSPTPSWTETPVPSMITNTNQPEIAVRSVKPHESSRLPLLISVIGIVLIVISLWQIVKTKLEDYNKP